MTMEKRGVACHCAEGKEPEDLTKTASGDCTCPHCGKEWAKKDSEESKDEA